MNTFAAPAENVFLAKARRVLYNTRERAGVMEFVDVVDSKSTASDGVPVRVRPPAPRKKPDLFTKSGFFQLYSPAASYIALQFYSAHAELYCAARSLKANII